MRNPVERWNVAALELLSDVALDGPGRAMTIGEAALSGLRDREIDSLYYLSRKPLTPGQRFYDKVWSLQRRLAHQVIGRAGDEGISLLIYKGAEVFCRYYGRHALGLMYDVDVLVRPRDIGQFKAVLYGLGLRPGKLNRETGHFAEFSDREVAAVEAQHYELAPFGRVVDLDLDAEELDFARAAQGPMHCVVGGTARVLLCLDVHHRLVGDIVADAVFGRAVQSALPGALTLEPSDHLWFLASKYYIEVALHKKRTLRDLVYLLNLLRVETFDWERVLEMAKTYELYAALYYTLGFLSSLFPRSVVAPEVLKALHPARGRRHSDWGWQLGPLFDFVEPLPAMRSELEIQG